MSKYNVYAKQLDDAFKTARDEYKAAFDKFHAAENNRNNGVAGSPQRQRAELDYQDAQREFKTAGERVWDGFNRQRAELRAKLAAEVKSSSAAIPDAVDPNGLELLKSGILSADDFFTLADRYNGNATMLRLVAKYAKLAADNMDGTQAKHRGALYQLADSCKNGQGQTMQAWDNLSRIADYCSGQAREKRDRPNHILSMGQHWEHLSGETIENF